MARAHRQTAPGAVHHIVNRGNRKRPVFLKRGDYQAFMKVLAQAVAKFRMRVISFSVMGNHWHLVLWPRECDSISAFMHWLTSTHVRRYHLHYGLRGTGHLYQDRFRNDVVRDDRALLAVMRYVEGNPVAAGITKRAEDYEWSSLWLRVRGKGGGILSPCPIPLPSNWAAYVTENTPRKPGGKGVN
jgi:putative transposase